MRIFLEFDRMEAAIKGNIFVIYCNDFNQMLCINKTLKTVYCCSCRRLEWAILWWKNCASVFLQFGQISYIRARQHSR